MIKDFVIEYDALTRSVDALIKEAGYRIDYVCKSIGISSVSFHRKRKNGSFTVDEMIRIADLLDRQEIEDKKLVSLMEKAKNNGYLSNEEASLYFPV